MSDLERVSLLPLRQGDVLAGKYRIERSIGVGGMGAVFAATHLILDEPVAIKILLPSQLHRPDAALRFIREGRAASKIKSDHVARVLDVGSLESGLPFLVMEFLEGEDLATRIHTLGPRPLHEVVGWILQVCEAIEEAHSKGIIHRDLKPSNLFAVRKHDGREQIKVLDFGISKVSGELSDGFMTASRAMLGSPFYMAPEQMSSSGTVDGRADIWSLGCVMFEALTGRPPFLAEDVTVLVARVLHELAPSVRELRPDLPPEIDAIVARCLSKKPQERFPDVRSLAGSLAPFSGAGVGGEFTPPPKVSLEVSLQDTAPHLVAAGSSMASSGASSPRLVRPVLLGVLALAGLGGGLWVGQSMLHPAPSPASSIEKASASQNMPSASVSTIASSPDPAPTACVLPVVKVASAAPSSAPGPTPPVSSTSQGSRGNQKNRPVPGAIPLLPQDRD